MADLSRSSVGDQARSAARGPWVEALARLGYVAKGVVYVVVGGLAVQAALGGGGETTGSEGALRAIGRQPFGEVLLWVLAVGLVGYSLWRLVSAFLDPEGKGTGAAEIANRGGYLASGVVHGLLAAYAFGLATGDGGGGGGGTETWTARVLAHPFGAWLVGLAGLAVAVYAVKEAYVSYTRKYREDVAFSRLDLGAQRWIVEPVPGPRSRGRPRCAGRPALRSLAPGPGGRRARGVRGVVPGQGALPGVPDLTVPGLLASPG
jgi:hypothetical protein